MKVIATLCSVIGIGAGISAFQTQPEWTVLISGDTDGYLAPCGCTKPMSGGLKRRLTLVRQLARGRKTLILENSGLVAGNGRHDVLKAEALAEALVGAGYDALHLGPAERRLGAGAVESLLNFDRSKWISAESDSDDLGIAQTLVKGPFLVGTGRSSQNPLSSEFQMAIDAGRPGGHAPILLFQGSIEEAARIARDNPKLRLIVARVVGSPTLKPTLVGSTWIVSPGNKGRFLLRASYRDGAFRTLEAMNLSESVSDDPFAQRVYERYLGRVHSEDLLGRLPRVRTPLFAGNAKCMSCHADAAKVWKSSEHAGAIATLQHTKNHRDPDCVGCHVVGLESESGFRSEVKTPQLKNVGCESCHGPGAEHAQYPKKVKMPRLGAAACASCHNKDHSPNFDYKIYWQKIAH